MPDEHTTPLDTGTQQKGSKKPKVTYNRRAENSYVKVKKDDNQSLSEFLISVRDSSAQQTRSESETSQTSTTSDELDTFKAIFIADDDKDCMKLYEYLKNEYQKLLNSIAGESREGREKKIVKHINFVMSVLSEELYGLFQANPKTYQNKIEAIARNSQLCWMLAVYASKVSVNGIEALYKNMSHTIRPEEKRKVFSQLARKPNDKNQYLFYHFMQTIRLRYIVESPKETLAQSIIQRVQKENSTNQQTDVPSFFIESLDPLVVPSYLTRPPSFYEIEHQPTLLEHYPYTNLNTMIEKLKSEDTEDFKLLVAELQMKKFSVTHFCIMLKKILVQCLDSEKIPYITSEILAIMGETLLQDKRVLDLLSKTPQFFPILSKYVEKLPPLPPNSSIEKAYPIVHYFRHHTDFNLNLFRAKKEAAREHRVEPHNSVVNRLFEHHMTKSCFTTAWWLGKVTEYKQLYSNFSSVVDAHDPTGVTVDTLLESLRKEKNNLSTIWASNRIKALETLIKKIEEVVVDSEQQQPLATLDSDTIKNLQICIEAWKIEKAEKVSKSHAQLFEGTGWKPSSVKILLSNVEMLLDKISENKSSPQAPQ